MKEHMENQTVLDGILLQFIGILLTSKLDQPGLLNIYVTFGIDITYLTSFSTVASLS